MGGKRVRKFLKKYKGSLLLITALLVVAMAVAGCGGSKKKSNSGGNSGGESPSTIEAQVLVDATNTLLLINQEAVPSATATNNAGTIAVSNTVASGNAFKYGGVTANSTTNNNVSYLTLPKNITGDFSIEATIVTGTQNNASNNSNGIGVGFATGFSIEDSYDFALIRNSSTSVTNYYVKGTGTSVGTGSPATTYAAGDSIKLTLSRASNQLTMNLENLTSGASNSNTFGTGNCYNSGGYVFPCIAFAGVDATITDIKIIDKASGADVVLIDTATNPDVVIQEYKPATLTVGATLLRVKLDATGSFTYNATEVGGAAVTPLVTSSNSSIVRIDSFAEGTVSFSGVGVGTATITVTNGKLKKTVTVIITNFPDSDSYGTIATNKTYPAIGATAAYTDGKLRLTFDNTPVLQSGGTVAIYKADGTLVDTIAFESEKQVAYSTTLNVGSQLVQVSGKDVLIQPHFDVLEYGTEYYVAIPKNAITGTFNGFAFNGFTDVKDVATWKFTTKANPGVSTSNITVDGSETSTADFRSVHKAMTYASGDATITVAAGIYTELVYYKGNANITLAGPSGNDKGDNCIIQYTNINAMNGSTHTRASFYYGGGSNLVLKNITLKNTASREDFAGDTQAEAIYFANGIGKTFAAYNCSFISYQDTIQTTGKNWFYKCYIKGDTDYIWGTADVALFEDCDFKCVLDPFKSNKLSYLLVSRTGNPAATTVGKGYVIYNSRITMDSGMEVSFGRNAGGADFYDQCAVIDTTITGDGLQDILWSYGSSTEPLGIAVDANGNKNVGWKDYNLTLNGKAIDSSAANAAKHSGAGTITASVYNLEYNGRRAILNRVYNLDSKAYEYATASWDISSLESGFGATSDASVGNDYGSTTTTVNWDFKSMAANDVNFQGTSGVVAGTIGGSSVIVPMTVDATSGKLTTRGSDAQFNAGTKLTIPVTDGCTVTVISYPGYHNYTLAGTAAAADTVTYTHSGVTGTIDIVATGGAYLYSVAVSDFDLSKLVTAVWDYQNIIGDKDPVQGATSIETASIAGSTGIVTLAVDATASGAKYDPRTSDVQLNAGTELSIPVTPGSVVTVVAYSTSYDNYTLAGTDCSANETTTATYTHTGAAGTIDLIATAQSYIFSITVENLIIE